MTSIARNLILCWTLVILLFSCTKKEQLAEKFYYGNVQGDLKDLPGTPRMELFANNEKIADLYNGLFGIGDKIVVPADVPVNLEFRRQGTNEVLLDTTVTVPKYQSVGFNIAYSEDLGIKGFLQSKAVHPDSMTFQVVNNLTAPYENLDVDLYVIKIDLATYAVISDTLAVVPQFKKGQLMPPMVTVPNFPPDWGSDGTYPAYGAMMKDRKTGEFIIHRALGQPPFGLLWESSFYGKYVICVVSNDGGDYIYSNLVIL